MENSVKLMVLTSVETSAEARAHLVNSWRNSRVGLRDGVKLDENLQKFMNWLLDESGLVLYAVGSETITSFAPVEIMVNGREEAVAIL